jgi:lipoprotein-anchoring transpeptidase ErfK/SrfK
LLFAADFMKQFIFGAFLFSVSASFSPALLWAQEAVQPVVSAEPSWMPILEKAREMKKKGEYAEAAKNYQYLLEKEALGTYGGSIREEYDAYRMEAILSPIEMEDSLVHEVASGDNLYDLAKKHGTTIELIKKSNRLESDKILIGQKLKVTKIKFSLLIEKKGNYLILEADGKRLKKYSVATGENGSTPIGTFKIINKLENPAWFHAGAIVPPDSPDNILGTRWLGFDKAGYGIHGTTLPETIGTQSSKGCIRMKNSDVEELYDLLPLGTKAMVIE